MRVARVGDEEAPALRVGDTGEPAVETRESVESTLAWDGAGPQSRALEDAFLAESMPYKLVGATRFYARREIKDVFAYLQLVVNPADEAAFARAVADSERVVLFGSYAWVRDQLFLPAGDLSDEDVLTRRQALATGFEYFVSFGITYQFGSIFNNIVNPRFGGGEGRFFF